MGRSTGSDAGMVLLAAGSRPRLVPLLHAAAQQAVQPTGNELASLATRTGIPGG